MRHETYFRVLKKGLGPDFNVLDRMGADASKSISVIVVYGTVLIGLILMILVLWGRLMNTVKCEKLLRFVLGIEVLRYDVM